MITLDTILNKIQDTVAKYTIILSQILKVDVEIVDEEFTRVAGTVEYRNSISIGAGNKKDTYNRILATGNRKIIENTDMDELSKACKIDKNYIEKFEMSVPIKMNNEIIGTIGLICFKDGQRDNILKNIDIYKPFLEQIADLIGIKAFETIEKEKILDVVQLLKCITEGIEEAVIIFNNNGNVNFVNTRAQEILGINETSIKKEKVKFKETGKYILGKKEYKMTLNNSSYYLAGYMNIVAHTENMNMFVFNETKSIKNKIDGLTDMGDTIVFNNILGASEKITEVKNKILTASKSLSVILLTGEPGVGKEIFSRTIHNASKVKKPFVTINCETITGEGFRKELVKVERGSTIFFDEIGSLSPSVQVELLSFLKVNEIDLVVGSNNNLDKKIIAATNKNLEKLVEQGRFRKDLYYKLNVFPIEIPPLRERIEDIRIIAYFYLNKYSKLFNRKIIGINREIWDILCKYDWPDNVRELQNAAEFMINVMDESGIIQSKCIPKRILDKVGNKIIDKRSTKELNLKRLEADAINSALKIYGNTTKGKKNAADNLGIGIATLYRKIEEYNL